MDTEKCRAYLAAIDTGTFSAAAEKLGYTPSGINRMVSALEDEMGFHLLARSRKGVEATPDGERILPAMRQLIQCDEQIHEISGEVAGVISGHLTIGSYYSVAACWLPAILRAFHNDYPGIMVDTVEASTSELHSQLSEHGIDCCFLGSPAPKNDWIPLKRDRLVAWLPRSHPKASLLLFPLHDVDGEPFIWPMPNREVDIQRLCEKDGLTPDVRYTTFDSYTAYSMVAAGLGMSINNELMAKGWTGDVAIIPFDPPRSITLGIAIPSLVDASPATHKFIDCAKRIVKTL